MRRKYEYTLLIKCGVINVILMFDNIVVTVETVIEEFFLLEKCDLFIRENNRVKTQL